MGLDSLKHIKKKIQIIIMCFQTQSFPVNLQGH